MKVIITDWFLGHSKVKAPQTCGALTYPVIREWLNFLPLYRLGCRKVCIEIFLFPFQLLLSSYDEIEDGSQYREEQNGEYPNEFVLPGIFVLQYLNKGDQRQQEKEDGYKKNQYQLFNANKK